MNRLEYFDFITDSTYIENLNNGLVTLDKPQQALSMNTGPIYNNGSNTKAFADDAQQQLQNTYSGAAFHSVSDNSDYAGLQKLAALKAYDN